jgi:hypothetical protein
MPGRTHPAFLCIPKHRRGAGVYTPSWAGGITQKLIAMCEHWLPLKIVNVCLSFLLQMLHVKNTNWTPRFGAVASEPENFFNVVLDNDHKRKAAMDVKVFCLYLYPRFPSLALFAVCFDVGLLAFWHASEYPPTNQWCSIGLSI